MQIDWQTIDGSSADGLHPIDKRNQTSISRDIGPDALIIRMENVWPVGMHHDAGFRIAFCPAISGDMFPFIKIILLENVMLNV